MISARKSRDSSRVSSISKKPEVLKPVSDRFSTAPDSDTYHLADRSSLYDEQGEEHVAMWASTLKAQMRVQTFHPMDAYL